MVPFRSCCVDVIQLKVYVPGALKSQKGVTTTEPEQSQARTALK